MGMGLPFDDDASVKWSPPCNSWTPFRLRIDEDGGVWKADSAIAVVWKDRCTGGVNGPGVVSGCFSTCNAEMTTASR